MLKVGFIGLGNMGEGMALNLARAGFPLTVRDVRPGPIARLEAAGATAVPTNFEVGSRSDLSASPYSMRSRCARPVCRMAPIQVSSRDCARGGSSLSTARCPAT